LDERLFVVLRGERRRFDRRRESNRALLMPVVRQTCTDAAGPLES
jgi:hypothetical protein